MGFGSAFGELEGGDTPTVGSEEGKSRNQLIEELRALRLERTVTDAALEAQQDTFFLFEPATGRAVRWNRAFREISGYSDEEIAELAAPASYFSPDDLARVAEFVEQVLTGGPASIELDLIRKDGRTVPTEYRVSAIGGEEGEPQYLISIGRDVTARMQVEAELRASEERYRALIENADILVSVYDRDGVCQFMNAKLASVFGDSPDRLVGRGLADLHPGMAAEYTERIRTVIDSETKMSFDDVVSFPLGDRLLISNVRPIIGADGSAVAAQIISHDVTEVRKLEEQRAQMQRIEAVGKLAGGIAHDFNNLVTVISNTCDLVATKLDDDHAFAEDLREIRTASDRAAELTNQLLAFSRKQLVRPRTMSLNMVVRENEEMLRLVLGEDVDLVVKVDPGLPNTRFDPGQAERILLQLAGNARDAMPDGGRLTIETASVELDDSYHEHHPYTAPGPYVMLEVNDTGRGMDNDTRTQVFEPFFTTKKIGQGPGLGLSTVYGIVKQLGGSVEIDSETGRGTSVKIYLPVDAGEAERETEPTTAEPPTAQRTVLLVEDEASVRRIAHRILEKLGYRVLVGTNGKDALRVAEAHSGAIDLVLSDVLMPEMSGRECVERLSEIRPGLKVIYMSGYTESAIADQGVLDEGTEFLQKPFSIDTLAAAVRRVLAEDSVRS
jgi:two-component system, cell cycle sensor histidine kinase and response regulator CckA